MKFKKNRTHIAAFAENCDDLSGTGFKSGDRMGSINIKTGICCGATKCFSQLRKHWAETVTRPSIEFKVKIEVDGNISDKDAKIIQANILLALRNYRDQVGLVPDSADYHTKELTVHIL